MYYFSSGAELGGAREGHCPPKILPGPPVAPQNFSGLFLKVLHRPLTAPLVAKLAPPNENVCLRPCLHLLQLRVLIQVKCECVWHDIPSIKHTLQCSSTHSQSKMLLYSSKYRDEYIQSVCIEACNHMLLDFLHLLTNKYLYFGINASNIGILYWTWLLLTLALQGGLYRTLHPKL